MKPVVAAVLLSLALTACDSDSDALPASVWSGSATFEAQTDDGGTIETFEFDAAPWDGDEHLIPAAWQGCGLGSTSCEQGNAQCRFQGGDSGDFRLECHALGGDYNESNRPCVSAEAMSLCAGQYIITSAAPECADRPAPNVYCADVVEREASAVTGGHERELPNATISASWELVRP
jgi:hypothetical protein